MIYELIYCSEANEGTSQNEIHDILNVSRDFNKKHDITGCLLFHNDEFIQILEGEKDVINELYKRIEKDTRHYNVQLFYTGEKDMRAFESWSMAYKSFSKSSLQELERKIFIDNFLLFSQMVDKPSEAVKLFYYMAETLLEE